MKNPKNSLLALLAFPCCLSAQNLLINPSFEQSKPCGQNELVDSVVGWSALAGKPKFINIKCAISPEARTYIRGMQLPDAADGKVYAGLGMDKEGEFLQGQLQTPLVKGEVYWLKARVRLPVRFCNSPIQELGFLLTAETLKATEDYQTIDKQNIAVKKENNKLIDNTYEWVEISEFYTAEGGERFLVIGNFANNNQSQFAQRKKGECSYLYIDAVSVGKFEEINLKAFEPNALIVENERLLLKNINFEQQNKLDKKSESALKSLVSLLEKQPDLRVHISAHCDNSLPEAERQPNTQAKADAVAAFLSEKGIDNARISTQGIGSSQSIAPNNNEANRAKNNRIELIFSR